MKFFARFLIVAVLYLAPLSVFAFGNEDVIKLISAGFAEETILKAIATANPVTFDTSADGLIGLKKAGASEAVIRQILLRTAETGLPSQAALPYPLPRTSGEQCQLEAGMGSKVSVRVEGKTISLPSPEAEEIASTDRGSIFANAFSFGIAKIQTTGSLKINGERSSIRTTEKMPEFLDLIVPFGALPEKTLFLVHLTVKERSRVVQTISVKTSTAVLSLGSVEAARDFGENILVPLVAEKTRDQCTWGGRLWTQYKMKPATPLEKGEYGLLTFSVFGRRIYDFAVD